MRGDLLARLRADNGVAVVAGTIPLGAGTRPAVDWLERQSDEASAFPAAVLQVVSGAGEYDQDGPSGLEFRRVRIWSHGQSHEEADRLRRALRNAIQARGTHGSTRFGPGKLLLERDLPPEDLPGGLKIYRIAEDYVVPAAPA